MCFCVYMDLCLINLYDHYICVSSNVNKNKNNAYLMRLEWGLMEMPEWVPDA